MQSAPWKYIRRGTHPDMEGRTQEGLLEKEEGTLN